MNRLQVLAGALCIIISISSCDRAQAVKDTKQSSSLLGLVQNTEHNNNSTRRPIKYFPVRDAQRNMLMGVLPIPSDWNLSTADDNITFLESPKGVKVLYIAGNEFLYSQNPYINQSFQQMGFDTKPPQSFEEVLSLLKEHAIKKGVNYVKQYPLPQLEAVDASLDRLIYKPVPEQKTAQVVATEWIDTKGNASLLVLHYYVAQTELSLYWGYRIESMESPQDHFNTAKRDYLNTLINTQINPQWLQTINAENRQKSQQMMAGHNQRMEALRAQGRQIIAAGKQHDAMTSRNHQKFIDGLRDEINVTSPATGQTYKVNLGSNHYWINDSNQLITSNDATFDPNQNNDSRGVWVEAEINN